MAPELDAVEAVMQVLTDYGSPQKHDVYVLPKAWTPIEVSKTSKEEKKSPLEMISSFIQTTLLITGKSQTSCRFIRRQRYISIRSFHTSRHANRSKRAHIARSYTRSIHAARLHRSHGTVSEKSASHNISALFSRWAGICRPDHFEYSLEKLRLDIEEPTHWWSYRMCKLPHWVRIFLVTLKNYRTKTILISAIINFPSLQLRQLYLFLFGTRQQRLFMRYITHDTNELRKLVTQLQTFRAQMQKKWSVFHLQRTYHSHSHRFASKVDVILCPVAATPAVSHATVIEVRVCLNLNKFLETFFC